MFWLIFDWFFDQCFDWFVISALIFWLMCKLWWMMFDWDWVRALRNEVNWYSAVHCKNDLIDLDWEAWDDLIKWKLLYAQCYTHEVWFQTLLQSSSRNTDVFFKRRIIIIEYFINSSRFSLVLKINMNF